MILYGASPNDLATQQYQRDQMGQSAAENTRSELLRTQLQAVQNSLAQKNAADNLAQRQSELNQAQGFQANQNALERASRLADVQAQYGGSDKQNEVDYRQAADQAQKGFLLPDKAQIRAVYAHFRPDQVDALYSLAGQAAVNKAELAAQNANKAGNAPDVNSILAAAGLKGTPFEDKGRAAVLPWRAQFEQDFTQGKNLADAGNAAQKISTLQASVPNPNTAPIGSLGDLASTWGQLRLAGNAVGRGLASLIPSDTATANPVAASRMAAITASLSSKDKQGNVIVNPLIQRMPDGSVAPAAPPSWAPLAFAPQTATAAPVMPPASAPPAARPIVKTPTAEMDAKSAIFKGAPAAAVHARFIQKYGYDFQ